MLSAKTTNKISTNPTPQHLWSTDPKVSKIRLALFIFWVKASLISWILILLVALIYLGSGTNPSWHTKSLDVFVTNFDNGIAGNYFIEAFQNTPSGNQTLNWIFQQPPASLSAIVDQIEHGKAWGSVYINAGTSDRLNQVIQAIINGNVSSISYLPSSAITIVYDQGRSSNTVGGYVLPPIRAAILVASARYSAYMQNQVLQQTNATLSNVIAAISVASITHSPIGSTDMNIHPATPYASLLATTLGYLFLWLMTGALAGMAARITQPLAGKIKIIDIVVFRILNTIINGLILSLIYSLIILWLADFTRPVPFIRFWLFNWLAVITFAAIIGLFIINLGAIAQAALVLFLITNLSSSTSNVAIELQNKFYRIGYGLPLFHCFSGGRHFLFGSYAKLSVDIGVLFAYYFGCIILLILTGVYRMRKQEKQIIEKSRKTAAKKTNPTLQPRNITTKKK